MMVEKWAKRGSFVMLKLKCVSTDYFFLFCFVTVLLVLCFEEEETLVTKFEVWEK